MTDRDAAPRLRFRVGDLFVATALIAIGCAWPLLFFFILPILLAMALNRMGYGSDLPVLLSAVLSLTIGVAVSYSYWHYMFVPPRLLPELRRIARVERISRFHGLDAARPSSVQLRPLTSVPPLADLQTNSPAGLMPHQRILEHLGERGIPIQSSAIFDANELVELWQTADREGLLFSGEPGYPNAKKLYGYVGSARDVHGGAIIFLTAMGDQYSNDHYLYYEIAYRRTEHGFEVVNWLWYFEDIAGIEGMIIWLPVAILCFLITCPLAFVVRASLQKRRRRALRSGIAAPISV